MDMAQILQRSKEQMRDATGLKHEGVTRVFKDDKGWHIGIELLEMSRIPNATDVLGAYDVLLAEDGSLVTFRRKRTRLRGEPMDENNGETNHH